jgi:hypothetical protein
MTEGLPGAGVVVANLPGREVKPGAVSAAARTQARRVGRAFRPGDRLLASSAGARRGDIWVAECFPEPQGEPLPATRRVYSPGFNRRERK